MSETAETIEDALIVAPFVALVFGRVDIALGLTIGNILGISLTKTKAGNKIFQDIFFNIPQVWRESGENIKSQPNINPEIQKSILDIWKDAGVEVKNKSDLERVSNMQTPVKINMYKKKIDDAFIPDIQTEFSYIIPAGS